MQFDYDYVIIGSGFGGSVSAMRLSEKGYKVAVLEAGSRKTTSDFPKTNWNLRKYAFLPKLGLKGIMRYTLLPHVLIISGAGVGGGSLVYANTLYEPAGDFFKKGSWSGLRDWETELKPYYARARKMLGVVESPFEGPGDVALRECVAEMGRGHTWRRTPVAVYFGEPGKTVPDPFFGGSGPERTGCTLCGGCMVGCRVGAKNTLDRNYLWFAEKYGTQILPERTVVDIEPLEGGGYAITSERSGRWFRKDRQVLKARGVILAAGVLGTNRLLMKCKLNGSLPHISDRLGEKVCTNSESILAVTTRKKKDDYSKGIAIAGSVFPEDETHIEVVRFPKGSDFNALLSVYLTDGGKGLPRPLRFLLNLAKHPVDFIRILWPFGWAERTSLLLAMQNVENYIRLVPKRLGRSIRLTSRLESKEGIPTYLPVANEIARKMAKKIDGIPQSSINEVMLDSPATAHILGGCAFGETSESGVIDSQNRVHGYENMYVCDGSMIPGNLGVNPSLTITAMTELAMSHIPVKEGHTPQPDPLAHECEPTAV